MSDDMFHSIPINVVCISPYFTNLAKLLKVLFGKENQITMANDKLLSIEFI